MVHEYEKETKNHYKDDCVAGFYHNAFAQNKGWNATRFRIIANRERAVVGRFLRQVPHQKILDLPAGTGKLALLFKTVGSSVKACDISENMLKVARKVYKEIQYEGVEFQVCDAEQVRETINDHFDLAVCLRLLHRVPGKVKMNILEELSSIADYSIVSFGVHSTYHKWRATLRQLLFGRGSTYECNEPFKTIVEKIEKNFEIIDYKWVLPWMSREIIFLLRPRGN